jgi:hypothetical protein
MWKPIVHILSLCLLLRPALAGTDDQTSSKINRGSFEDPAARLRPRFRYWLPDASVDIKTVQDNIKSAGKIGAGGVEFLPFYNYGGELTPAPEGSDWSKYGFGTPAFRKMFLAALQSHKEAGLAMDFALGPNQGQGVPADPTDEGLQWDLVSDMIVTCEWTFTKAMPSRSHSLSLCLKLVALMARSPAGEPVNLSLWCQPRYSLQKISAWTPLALLAFWGHLKPIT